MLLTKKYILFSFLLLFLSKLLFASQIICIDTGTLRSGINEVNDIVEIQEDNVKLTGAGYNNFKKVIVNGMTKQEVMTIFNENKVNTMVDPNTDIEYWEDPNTGIWYRIVTKPKYSFTIKNLTEQDINNLASEIINLSQKTDILRKVQDKILLDPNNSGIIRAGNGIIDTPASKVKIIKALFWLPL